MENKSPVSFKVLTISFCLSLLMLIYSFVISRNRLPYVVFCNVGQAEVGIIETNHNSIIVIDSGADSQVLYCLGRYTKFYKKTIDLLILSDNSRSHTGGFEAILRNYQIKRIILSESAAAAISNALKNLDIPHVTISSRRSFTIDSTYLALFPINGKLVTYAHTSYLNVIFTGYTKAADLRDYSYRQAADIITVPNHGSRDGLTHRFLTLAAPTYAVINVKKKNRYDYPADEILDLLTSRHIKILRTDKIGDIVFEGRECRC